MTCVSCEYQWCWLCESEYKYGHYASGKCQGQQFAKADYPKNIRKSNYNNRCNRCNRCDRCNRCNFGIHKIFKFAYLYGIIPLYFSDDFRDALLIKYLHILIFWFFGIYYIFFNVCHIYIVRLLAKSSSCKIDYTCLIVVLNGLALWVSFQIAFICLTSPSILICFINHKFFNIFLIFF